MNRQQRGQETRSHILEVAQALFIQNGYEATGVAEICDHAGVSKGAFYHHFASKQELFLKLLNRWLEGLEHQAGIAQPDTADVPTQLLHMASAIQVIFAEARGQLPIFLEFMNQAQHDPAVWEATVAPYRRYRALFAEMMRTGIEQGDLRPIDPDLAAWVLVSLAVGLVVQGLMDPDAADWGQAAQASVRLLLEGLERKVP